MRPNYSFWSQKSHFGLILFWNVQMLKTINEKKRVFCPIADSRLPHLCPSLFLSYLSKIQHLNLFWSQNFIIFYILMYAGRINISKNIYKIKLKFRIFLAAAL